MPIDPSIPLQGKRPDMLGRMSDLLGIQQQRQQLIGQQSANQSAAAAAAQAEQDLAERNAATEILKNQQKLGMLDQYGRSDLTKLIPAVMQAAPRTGWIFLEPITKGFLAQTEISQAAQNLNRSVREDVNGGLSAVATKPNASYGDVVIAADLIKKQNPQAAATVDALLSHLSDKDPMEATRQKLMMFGRTILPPSDLVGTGGLATPQATAMDTGAQIQPGVQDRQTGGFTPSGEPIQKTGVNLFVDPRTQNPYAITPQGNVRDLGNTSPTSMPKPFYAGQAADLERYQEDVANVRATADQAPLNRSIYQHILKLGDETNSGKFISMLQKNPIISQMFGDNFQELNKYLEKNAIANMQAMGGPPSDARLSAAAAANGGTDFNPEALKAVTRFNYATNTALEKFREGLDKAVGVKNPDYLASPEFKANWARNFDVNIFLLENAAGNEKLQDKIIDSLNLTDAQMDAMMQKKKNLDSLSKTGRLPQ